MPITGLVCKRTISFIGILGKKMILIRYFAVLDLADLCMIKGGIVNLNIIRFALEFITGRNIGWRPKGDFLHGQVAAGTDVDGTGFCNIHTILIDGQILAVIGKGKIGLFAVFYFTSLKNDGMVFISNTYLIDGAVMAPYTSGHEKTGGGPGLAAVTDDVPVILIFRRDIKGNRIGLAVIFNNRRIGNQRRVVTAELRLMIDCRVIVNSNGVVIDSSHIQRSRGLYYFSPIRDLIIDGNGTIEVFLWRKGEGTIGI